jgi:hypothetical protein
VGVEISKGNLAAAEFYHNLEQVKVCLATYRGLRRGKGNTDVIEFGRSQIPILGHGAQQIKRGVEPGHISWTADLVWLRIED